jgi:hypothetical protein
MINKCCAFAADLREIRSDGKNNSFESEARASQLLFLHGSLTNLHVISRAFRVGILLRGEVNRLR